MTAIGGNYGIYYMGVRARRQIKGLDDGHFAYAGREGGYYSIDYMGLRARTQFKGLEDIIYQGGKIPLKGLEQVIREGNERVQIYKAKLVV